MKIMVFDVPASGGGALSILNEFYLEVKENSPADVEWIFILSEPFLEETSNIKVLRFPWIKRSWLHRIYFDQFVAPKLVEKYKVDKIFSLQNVTIPRTKVKQVLYVHQPLPFVEYKFKFKENKLFWMYQNIISKKIIDSIKKSEKIIVQTNWMKDACIEKAKVIRDKVIICPPNIQMEIKGVFVPNAESLSTFFYPAGESYYKNHRLIVKAFKELKQETEVNFKVVFTLNGNENLHIKDLYEDVKKNELPIEFIGSVNKNEVFEYYKKSILIFPSYIETFGLPLLECKLHKGIILTADTSFSREILDDYKKKIYFNPFDSQELKKILLNISINDINYESFQRQDKKIHKTKLIDEVLF